MSRWIDATDVLPPEFEKVLVCISTGRAWDRLNRLQKKVLG